MLDEESLAKLDVFALAWEGSRTEQDSTVRHNLSAASPRFLRSDLEL